MRSRISFTLLIAFSLKGQQTPPSLEKATFVSKSFSTPPADYSFTVTLKKPLDTATATEFANPDRWLLYGEKITGDAKERIPPVHPRMVRTHSNSFFELSVSKNKFGGEALPAGTKIAATLVFQSQAHADWPPLSAPASIAAKSPIRSSLEPVTVVLDDDGKRDQDTKADIVVSGSLVAAVGSKPTYFYEAKMKYRLGQSRFNLNVSMIGNEGNNVDPDSIKAAFGYARPLPKWNGPSLFWRTTLKADILRGEFSRENQTANAGSSLLLETLSKPKTLNAEKTRFTYLQFKAGMEAVKNMNKPDSIPELKAYKGGARPLIGGTLTLVLDSEAYGEEEKVPLFTFTGDYLARIPLMQEPFTRMVDEKKVYSLSKKTRHTADITMLWQATNYWGIFSKYRYGSLPPLFVFTDHQVLFGVAFQAKWK